MSRQKTGLSVVLSLTAAVLSFVPPAAACATGHIRIQLVGFDPGGETRFAYFMPEPSGPTDQPFTMNAGGDACAESASVSYATGGGTATPGVDYTATSGTVSFYLPPHESAAEARSVTILNDGPDGYVESVDVVLSNPGNAVLGVPFTAPIFIIDDDPPDRVGLEGIPYAQSESLSLARIPVFWAGPSPGTVDYAVSSAGASPATPGEDFTGPGSGTLTFDAQRVASIDLSIVNDQLAESDETFNVTLSGASGGAGIVAGEMTFTIQDNEENVRPTSRLHHPRHGWRYRKSDYRIREIHTFATDNTGGSGVVASQLALRKNLKNGKCLWWTGQAWQQRDCQNEEWLPTEYDSVGELFRYRMRQLKSSVGTRIKSYTAFSRAIDGAGNVEDDFAQKRNDNTFEVKRRRR